MRINWSTALTMCDENDRKSLKLTSRAIDRRKHLDNTKIPQLASLKLAFTLLKEMLKKHRCTLECTSLKVYEKSVNRFLYTQREEKYLKKITK